MKKWGGSFTCALADAIIKADPQNTQKIKTTFSEEWEKYLEMEKDNF